MRTPEYMKFYNPGPCFFFRFGREVGLYPVIEMGTLTHDDSNECTLILLINTLQQEDALSDSGCHHFFWVSWDASP